MELIFDGRFPLAAHHLAKSNKKEGETVEWEMENEDICKKNIVGVNHHSMSS